MHRLLTRYAPLLVALPALAHAQPVPAVGTPTAPVVSPAPAAGAPAAPVVSPPSAPPLPIVPTPGAAPPLAGYQGSFFFRDPKDWFVLFLKGRLHIDTHLFPARGELPAGVIENSAADPRPRNTIFLRRARVELQGTFARHFDFHIAGDLSSNPSAGTTGSLGNAYVIVNYTPWAQLQIGQFDAPFTMENRTPHKTLDFLERSMTVRSFSVPFHREIGAMLWGYAPSKVAYYSAGVFNGHGGNFRNQDHLPAVIGRAFVAPLAPLARGRRWMEELEVGASVWWQRNENLGGTVTGSVTGSAQNDLNSMTTQGAVSFFSSSYANGKDAAMNPIRSHLVPDGDTFKWAVEAHLPWKRYGLKWELVKQSIALSRYDDTNPTNADIVRGAPVTGAQLEGLGTYVEAYAWILGGREIIDPPGLQTTPRLDFSKSVVAPPRGLQVLVRWDHVGFDITGLPPVGGADDPAQGHYQVDALQLGLNLWFSKNVRFAANYGANFIGGFSHGDANDPSNEDAANLQNNYSYNIVRHEIMFGAAIGI